MRRFISTGATLVAVLSMVNMDLSKLDGNLPEPSAHCVELSIHNNL